MTKIAIIGSCITRDLWPIRGDGIEALLYVSRTSLPSLFAAPTPGFSPLSAPPEGLTRYQHDAVVADVEKRALAALVAHRPTHLIFDFIDERFDLLATGDSLITHSWEMEATGYLARPPLAGARTVPRLSEACRTLWTAAAGELAAFIAATPLREARVILHEARWAERWRDERGRTRPFDAGLQIWDGRPADLSAHNRLLADYEAVFLSKVESVTRVAAPTQRLADAGHRWGLSPFHYVDEYYDEIWRQLQAADVTLSRDAASSAPSAPTA